MTRKRPHIIFCSSSFAEYDRRIQRISRTLSEQFHVTWLSRLREDHDWQPGYLNHMPYRCFFKKGFLFYIELNIRIFTALWKLKDWDIVSSVDIDTLGSAWLISVVRRKRIVFDAHELFHEVPELKNKKFKAWMWKSLSALLFKRITYKYTVNDSLKHIFKDEFNAEFDVVRNVPLLRELESLPVAEYRCMVYLGVVNQGRGLELAIHALESLKDYKLLVLGEGDLFEQMKNLCTELGIQSRVDFMGYISDNQIPAVLSKCSIALNMLDPSSGNYKNSLANKFFDYMHAALPSVNMNFPEYAAIQTQYPFSVLADHYTVEALLDALYAIQLPANYMAMQEAALLAREHFNWQAESGKLLSIYKNCLSDE